MDTQAKTGERAPEPRLLSSKEAAALFGVTNDYITQLARKGKVQGKLVGRLRYVEEDSVRTYLEGTRSTSRNPSEPLATPRYLLLSAVPLALVILLLSSATDLSGSAVAQLPTPSAQVASAGTIQSAWGRWTDWLSSELFQPLASGAVAQASDPQRRASDLGASSGITAKPATQSVSPATPPSITYVVTNTGVTEDSLKAQLNALAGDLTKQFARMTAQTPTIVSGPSAPIATPVFAQSQRIDNLSSVTISNSTIDTASIPDLSGTYASAASPSFTGPVSIDNSGNDSTPLSITTNGSAGNYAATTTGIFIYDKTGNEIARLVGSDPNWADDYNSANLYVGALSGYNQPYDNTSAGYYNTGVGAWSLYDISTGNRNTGVGAWSLASTTIGSYNTAIGQDAMYSNVDGSSNAALGNYALNYATSSNYNTAIGYSAGSGSDSYSNTGSTYLGYHAGYYADTGSDYNTFLGYAAGYYDTTGKHNIQVGAAPIAATAGITTGSQNVIIGYDINPASQTADGQLNIQNILFGTSNTGTGSTLSTGSIGIGTTTPAAKFDVYGDALLSGASRYLNFGNTSGTSGYGLRDNGGTLEFKNSGGSWAGIGSGGGSFAWTPTTNYGTTVNATSTPLWFRNGFYASSTAHLIGAVIDGGGYLNWGSTFGINGYGLRDSGGTMQVKNSGGSWTNIPTSGTSQWTTNGNNIYYTTGKVGIGTTSPATPLGVHKDNAGDTEIARFSDNTGAPYITVGNGLSSTLGGYLIWDQDGSQALGLGIHGTTAVLNIKDGNVGIGTTSPTTMLTLAGGDLTLDRGSNTSGYGSTVTIGGARNLSGTDFGTIDFKNYDSNDSAADYIGAQISARNHNSSDTGNLRFSTASSTSELNLAMIIDPYTKVGIGGNEQTPDFQLEIASSTTSGYFGISSTESGDGDIFLVDSSGNVGIGIASPTHLLQLGSDDAYKPGGGSWGDSSDERLKTNIETISATSALEKIGALNPVTFNWINPQLHGGIAAPGGFIAQELAGVFPDFVGTTTCQDADCALVTDTASTTYDISLPFKFDAYVVAAIQGLMHQLADLADTIAGFTEHFTTKVLAFGQATGDELCLKDSDGAPVCVTGDDLKRFLAHSTGSTSSPQAGSGQAEQTASAASAVSGASSADEESGSAPTIEVQGNDPAYIDIGATYADLGAIITGPTEADRNLGLHTYVGSTPIEYAAIDTSTSTTYHIYYVATNEYGTATSTRTVIVGEEATGSTSSPQASTPEVVQQDEEPQEEVATSTEQVVEDSIATSTPLDTQSDQTGQAEEVIDTTDASTTPQQQ